jgi:uncharacterized protein
VGEALVSMLDQNGVPTAVERARIRPPASRLDPATPSEIAQAIANGPLAGKYEKAIDRESAYEHLRRRAEAALPSATSARKRPTGRRPAQGRETAVEALAKGAARSIGSTLGRQIVRRGTGGDPAGQIALLRPPCGLVRDQPASPRRRPTQVQRRISGIMGSSPTIGETRT